MEVHLEILFHLVLAHDNSRNVVRISRFNQGFIASTGLVNVVSVDKFLAFSCFVIRHHVSMFDSSIPTEVPHKTKTPLKVRSIRGLLCLRNHKSSFEGSSCEVAHTFHWLIVRNSTRVFHEPPSICRPCQRPLIHSSPFRSEICST